MLDGVGLTATQIALLAGLAVLLGAQVGWLPEDTRVIALHARRFNSTTSISKKTSRSRNGGPRRRNPILPTAAMS